MLLNFNMKWDMKASVPLKYFAINTAV